MRRDLDLMRDLLIAVEKFPDDGFAHEVTIPGRTENELNSAIQLLRDCGMVDVNTPKMGTTWKVERLTEAGHDFLAAVRDDAKWNAAKRRAAKDTGVATLDSISESLHDVGKSWVTAIRHLATKWTPIFIAVMALCVSVISVFWTRDTNRRLMRPNLIIGSSGPTNPEFWFRNAGPGAARIKWIRAAADQQGSRDWAELARRLGFMEAEIDSMIINNPRGEFVLMPSEKLTMISFPSSEALHRFTEDKHLTLEVCNCSVYDECQTFFVSRSLVTTTLGCSVHPDDSIGNEVTLGPR